MCERISGSGDLVPKLTLKQHQSTGALHVTNALPPLDASTLKRGGETRMLHGAVGAVQTMNTTTSVTSEPSGMSTPPLVLLVIFFFFFFFFFYRCKKSNIFVYLNFYIEIVVQT